jgi:hypothetical protein
MGFFGVLEPGLGAAERLGHDRQRVVLALDALGSALRFDLEIWCGLVAHHPADRDAGPVATTWATTSGSTSKRTSGSLPCLLRLVERDASACGEVRRRYPPPRRDAPSSTRSDGLALQRLQRLPSARRARRARAPRAPPRGRAMRSRREAGRRGDRARPRESSRSSALDPRSRSSTRRASPSDRRSSRARRRCRGDRPPCPGGGGRDVAAERRAARRWRRRAR